MKFVSVKDLRGRTCQLWRDLAQEKDLVVTNNGKPVAILSSTDEGAVEQSLRDIRRLRASNALARIQRDAARRGLDKVPLEEIDAEIRTSRKHRHAR